MNSDNFHAERGNAMVYILVALALFGALTAVLARQGSQSDSQNLTEEMAQFESAQILSFSQSAQSAVNQMLMSGATVDDLIFDRPNDPSFDDTPYIHKVFHPEGGGLILKEANSVIFSGTDMNPPPGWYMGRFNNFEWTPSPLNDVILAAYQISKSVCESINEKITGSKMIPPITLGPMAKLLVDDDLHTGTNEEFSTADCAACEGYAMMCISNPAGTLFGFYAIIEGL